MKYFWRYLENEPQKFFQMARCFIFWFFFCFLYTHFVILHNWWLVDFNFLEWTSVVFFVYVALLEETFYRVLPFFLIRIFTPKKYFKPLIFFALILWSFMLFGFMHQFRAINILRQGVGGLVMGVVYLKFGGMSGEVFKPFLAASGFHWLWNVLILSLLYVKIS